MGQFQFKKTKVEGNRGFPLRGERSIKKKEKKSEEDKSSGRGRKGKKE